MDIKEASIDELKAELKRRERSGARVIEIPGPNENGSYGAEHLSPVSVWSFGCEAINLDPARVARAASLCLCMEDLMFRRSKPATYREFGLLDAWLEDMLKDGNSTEERNQAARRRGWID